MASVTNGSSRQPEFVITDDLLSPDDDKLKAFTNDRANIGLSAEGLPAVSSARSLENITLDTSPMDESIDLGNESLPVDQSINLSNTGLVDETLICESQPVDTNIGTHEDSHGISGKTVHFIDITDAGSTETAEDITAESAHSSVDCVIESTMKQEMMANPIIGSEQSIEVGICTVPAGDACMTDGNITDIKATSMAPNNLADDAVAVGFVEVKGIHTIASARSLSRFFMDSEGNVGGSDIEGKNFFDSFTAAEDESVNAASDRCETSPVVSEEVGSISLAAGSLPKRISLTGTPPVSLGNNVGSPARKISETTASTFPFHSSLSQEEAVSSMPGDLDPFSSGIFSNDDSRRCDAWIASDATRQILMAAIANAVSSSVISLPTHQTTKSVIKVEDCLGDPVHELVLRLMGEQEAAKRLVLNADSVPQDEIGLQQLIKADCLRAAVDLTTRLLTQCGQGPSSQSQPVHHTPYTLKLWYCRLALLVKLRLFTHAEAEMEQFGDLDTPDLYHEYYMQHMGAARHGSIVPFDMRLLHAELPQYLGRPNETIDRLYHLEAVITQILSNLNSGLAEDGSMLELNETSRQASKDLWCSREVKVLYSIGNCLLNIKDYTAALEIYKRLLVKDESNRGSLNSGIGRIYLQLGDTSTAGRHFDLAETSAVCAKTLETSQLMRSGLLLLCRHHFVEAYDAFRKLTELDPGNIVAVNNMAVCSLYIGRLKEALNLLESMVYSDPTHNLQEGILLNLCTLYELESSRAHAKKLNLLGLVNQYKVWHDWCVLYDL